MEKKTYSCNKNKVFSWLFSINFFSFKICLRFGLYLTSTSCGVAFDGAGAAAAGVGAGAATGAAAGVGAATVFC